MFWKVFKFSLILINKDIKIEYTGLKLGEKLTESLSYDSEELMETANNKLMLVRNNGEDSANLDLLGIFVETASTLSGKKVKEGIRNFVKDYNGNVG